LSEAGRKKFRRKRQRGNVRITGDTVDSTITCHYLCEFLAGTARSTALDHRHSLVTRTLARDVIHYPSVTAARSPSPWSSPVRRARGTGPFRSHHALAATFPATINRSCPFPSPFRSSLAHSWTTWDHQRSHLLAHI